MQDQLNSQSKIANQLPSASSILASSTVFQDLTPVELQIITTASQVTKYKKGQAIWAAGSPSVMVGLVGTGFVKMSKTTPQGAEVFIDLMGQGQCIGLVVAIEDKPYPLHATALTECNLLKIPRSAALEVYNSNSAFRDHLLQWLAPRLRRAHENMVRFSAIKIEQRVASILIHLLEAYGEPQLGGQRIGVPLTRQDLADMTGTTVETTIRIMSRFQKEGLILTEKQYISVLDPEQLAYYASI